MPAGEVISSDPPSGSPPPSDQRVTITVSTGDTKPATAPTCPPAVLALTQDQHMISLGGEQLVIDLELCSVSSSTCSLGGRPTVTVLDIAGRPLPF